MSEREDAFSGYHPVVNLLFFTGAIVCGMFFVHPAFLAVSLVCSLSYYLLLKGKKGLVPLCGILLVFTAIALLNPVFNTMGETVLFTLWNGRHFTLEALCYGMATGCMFVTVILWFACYNMVMTSDKLIALCGKGIPALSLVLSMVLRLIPNMQIKIKTILNAQICIGKSPQYGTQKEKLQNGAAALSVLTSWALESSVMMADSMKSRGYGSGMRSSFAPYRWQTRDKIIAALLLCCAGFVAISAWHGAMAIQFLPVMILPTANGNTILGLVGYGVFLSTPAIIHLWEEAIWSILQSKI
ncbi:MAG: energy-coupling factor transporter transmembrane component T [Ruthenibacterium sp.]